MRYLLLISALLSVTVADRILVLVECLSARETHSIFFRSLQDRGHQLVFRTADDSSLSLIKFGELNYDHLIIFAPSVDEFGGSISVEEITRFVDEGGNLLVTGGPNLGQAVRELALQHGFEFDEPDTMVIDHNNYDTHLDDGYHTTIVATKQQLLNAQLITGEATKLNPVLYKGVAMISHKNNLLRLEILRGTSTSYSFNPTSPVDEYPGAIGQQVVMVGAVQARNNARAVFTGSMEMFSDAFLSAYVHKTGSGESSIRSGNLELVTALSKWVLKENGVLRVKKVEHHLAGNKEVPREYTIMDEVEYAIEIEELRDGVWRPFNAKDVQLEFVRIDPFVRTNLINKNGRFSTRFKLPDVYGVYKFLVDYRRIGYTHLYDVQQVSVRPLLHNQYERFIRSAYPYYASSFSMMEYAIEIEELRDGVWRPFNAKDVQLEFVRIDPFVRTNLINKNGRFSTRFKLPDVYGVYKFLVDYRRIGYTHLYDVQQVSVRPLLHNQYERFIRSAYPYYASSFSMMVGVVLFSFVFLHHKDPPKATATSSKKTN
ncbi:Dolichyl-diphosphooligosaccharide-protein glycosyltransferase subunit [Ancylostoma caninum]|uniref:Dolichyl-diphosphooligosaccharide--protein glycosyltransferase 48 kDa subunit n=1 Tax=Ancylostoma caninum TaxID=29170 RepID=A0A368GRK5_ANCCA|nr:Dolichyl-diphosphooligosaccharide-protein glycosyltransferase subunit [Ancylostoma caninum]